MSAPPVVPQRPTRSQAPAMASTLSPDMPVVPPRPARHVERSASPNREAYTRSPLNDSPFAQKIPSIASFQEQDRGNGISLHPRMPSVSQLPLIGQEGMEYASFDEASSSPEEVHKIVGRPAHTANVAGDLPMHAPKASVSATTARNQVATVTRADSTHATAAGLGRRYSDHEEPEMTLRRPSSTSRPEDRRASGHYSPDISRSASRPASIYGHDHDHGIPEIGLQVPMYPHAGDVQAPSPGPSAHFSTGIGFFNSSSNASLNQSPGRRKSAQGFRGPPGSYGMHGHGVQQHDSFEKAWYSKHPDEFAKEKEGAYGPGLGHLRGEFSMSSEDLNKLVHESSSKGLGFGTSPAMIGTPSEDIGFMATEEYALRIGSPRSGPLHLNKTQSRNQSGIQPQMNSPLRKASTPHDFYTHTGESELEEDAIHLDPPTQRHSKIHGGGYDPPTADLGPSGGNTDEYGGWIDERGSGVPILASDEISKTPGAEYMRPAISPELEKRGDETYFASTDPRSSYQSDDRERSTSRSRARFQDSHHRTGTPLENVAEYEPLFDEKEEKARAVSAVDRFKRPELEKRFPSQDIWEDTPNSLQYTTTVDEQEQDTIQSPVDVKKPASTAFELPEKEQARKGEVTEDERRSFLTEAKGHAKPKFSAGVQRDMVRPGMRHRFPSQDIWEDTPDSLRLETTVEQDDKASDTTSPRSPTTGETIPAMNSLAQNMMAVDPALTAPQVKPTSPPSIPPRPTRSHVPGPSQDTPALPARPPQRMRNVPPADAQLTNPTTLSKSAETADRPKPQVPPRPARVSHEQPSEPISTPIIKTSSVGSTGSTEDTASADQLSTSPTKTKPVIPSKPAVSGKFASLKAGFMNDLNSRLQLGPQAAPKPQPTVEPEAEEEKAPLADARKGRARGPARRKPAESAEAATTTSSVDKSSHIFSFFQPAHVWSIDPSSPRTLLVGAKSGTVRESNNALQSFEQPTASPLASNTAGEALSQPTEASTSQSNTNAHASNTDMDARARANESEKQAELRPYIESSIGHPGDVPEPVIEQPLPDMTIKSTEPPLSGQQIMGTDALRPALESSTLETAPDPQDKEPLLGAKHTLPSAEYSSSITGAADNTNNVELANTTQVTASATEEEAMPGGFPAAVGQSIDLKESEQGL